MAQTSVAANPFMLMLNPELVLAAVEKSQRLGALERRMCRPLDRITPAPGDPAAADAASGDLGEDEADTDEVDPTQ